MAKQEEVERLFDTEVGMWQKILDSNLTGTYLCSRKAGMIMREQKYGSIVSVTSTAAHRASPGMNLYGIAKAGIEMMTKNLPPSLRPTISW